VGSVARERRRIFPVLLSGGDGLRLWPLSLEERPKQLLPLTGAETLLQATVRRVSDPTLFEALTVIANNRHRTLLQKQLQDTGAGISTIVLEPAGRNTAAAAAVAALMITKVSPTAPLLLLPADHRIEDDAAFRETIGAAVDILDEGRIVLFGIRPRSPSTSYGYIRAGDDVAHSGARRVMAFVEKPHPADAEFFLANEDYVWNSGIVLTTPKTLLAEFSRHAPDILKHATEAVSHGRWENSVLQLERGSYDSSPSIALDHAIMERTDRAVVVPAAFDWADVGSWSALWEMARRDDAGNAVSGSVLTADTNNSYVRSEGPLVATIGVSDLVVVATPDAVLVAQRDQAEAIKALAERLRLLSHKQD
jgi:mannose-1-phosphate guanylyltransferase/mannose-1-phosphate guanylyltransferase/mannose-6-phosphate isomerase